ncbi:SIR2 family protein [Nannocystis sp.]|uniref:SIR2 family NAD-dependent protein deacylase n=1 Tax=Nannocystis sp. TaxID=1962667 RepID=UPI00344C76E3
MAGRGGGGGGAGGELRPDVARPLVYHLFGRLDARDAMVLTEDDYFDFLIGVTGNRDLIPVTVRRALADTALLFLGFHMEDWNFRVLFRSIMSQQGGGRRKRYAHIAAQIDPEQGRAVDIERARRYLEEYFDEADITIYWGSAEDFLAELRGRLEGKAT